MITLIGVGHVFAISDKVKELIRARSPELVCLELDPARYHALMHPQAPRSLPVQYRLLAYFQKSMASKFGTEVGDEMLAGAAGAQEVGARLALIDMESSRVFLLLWKRMTMKERLTLLGGAFVGIFASKEMVEKELDKYERNESDYIAQLGEGYPTIKEVLIDDRNRHMSERLKAYAKQYGRIVAVVGDGHIPGLIPLLEGVEIEIIRLRDIRSSTQPPQASSQYSATYWYRDD